MRQNIIGAKVHQYRKARNLTMEELGAMIDAGHSYISQVESGKLIPSAEALGKLALALQVSADILLGIPTIADTNNDWLPIEMRMAAPHTPPERLRQLLEFAVKLPPGLQEALKNVAQTMLDVPANGQGRIAEQRSPYSPEGDKDTAKEG